EGAAFVPMETVAAPSGMPVAIANSLGLQLPPTGSQEEHLLTGLKSRRLLLVLDNLEHLVAGAGLLSRVLAECRGVTMLVTSRAALGIGEEQILELRGLPLRDADEEGSAQALLKARMRQHSAPARPTDSSTAEAELCALLDGNPLAIELAAALTRVMPLADLVDGLKGGLGLLVNQDP